MIHKLKTVQPYFDRVNDGDKKFEVRYNDRDFQTGDVLILQEYDPFKKEYSGRELTTPAIYVLNGGEWGIESGYVVIGLGRATLKPK